MKKKVLLTLVAVLAVMGITKNVYAETSAYYTTQNGIELTRDEYKFLTTFYGKGYLDIMTQAMYDEFISEDVMNSDVEIITYDEPQLALLNPGMSPRSTSHSTSAKTVQIGKACLPTKCIMTITNTWHVDPSVRSWDNIGAYLSGVSLDSYSHAYVSSDEGTVPYYNWQTEPDGVGNSVKLPDTGSSLIVSMGFKVTKGGTVFGSYQHAMQNTTLLNSQNYNLDIIGYGNVFDYYGNAVGIYDGMNGVDITV